MIASAYWINPNGQILDIDVDTHISQIIKEPEKFGMTKEKINNIYKKHNEPIGLEGQAREELIMDVLKLGFIRIRLYINMHWSITIYGQSEKTKKIISSWANFAKDDKKAGPYMPVVIIDLKTDSMDKYEGVKELVTENSITLQWVSNLSEFATYKFSFKEYLLFT